MNRVLASACWAILAFTSSAHAQAPRRVEQIVHSEHAPNADFVIDPTFEYLGRTENIVMQGRATAERFWFGRIEDGRIDRAIVIHFEHWNDGVDGTFDYPTFRLRQLGSHNYLHQGFPMENCPLATPDARTLIEAAGARFAQHCVTVRFVRAVDANLRSEAIIFYVEPVEALPSPEGLGPGGLPEGYDQPTVPETPWSLIDRRLTEEALNAITVRDRE